MNIPAAAAAVLVPAAAAVVAAAHSHPLQPAGSPAASSPPAAHPAPGSAGRRQLARPPALPVGQVKTARRG